MNSERNDSKNDPFMRGENLNSPPEISIEVTEETAVLHDKTEACGIYPGKPLDAEAKQIELPGCVPH